MNPSCPTTLGCLQSSGITDVESVGVGAGCFDGALSTCEDARAPRRAASLFYVSVFSLCVYACLPIYIYVFTILFRCMSLSSNIHFRSHTIPK